MSRLAVFFRTLIRWFRRWASPIVYDDTVEAHTGALISTLLLITAALWSSAVILMALLNTGNRVNINLALIGSALLLGVRELVRRGRTTLATVLGVASVWAVVTAFHYNLGTPYSVHLFGYLMLVIVAAWLSGWGGGLAAALLSVASIYALARAESAGVLPPAMRMQPLNLALNMAGYLGASFGLFWLARSNFRSALGQAQAEIARRKEAETALCDLNATLEQQVAERTRAQRESEERYRTLLALSPDRINVVDNTGRILFCNEQFALMCGFAGAEELIGRHALEFTTPEAYQRLFGDAAAVLQSGHDVARDIEGLVVARHGAVIDLEYGIARVPWPAAPMGQAFLCIARDVTRRKAVQAELDRYRDRLEELVRQRTTALRRSEELLTGAERIAHIGSWERDLITGELHISDGLYRILGFDPGMDPQAVYAAAWERVHPDDAVKAKTEIGRAQATGTPVDVTFRIIRPSGETIMFHMMAEFDRDAAGQPVRMRATAHDITEAEHARQHLARRVEELTRLQELGHLVPLDLPLQEISEIYLDRMVDFAEVDLAQVSLLRDGELQAAAIRTGSKSPVVQPLVLAAGECLCGRAMQGGEPLFAEEVEGDARCTLGHCRANGLHSVAALPLKTGDAAIGVLTLGAVAPRAFAGKHEFLEVVADLMAIRLHNATLHQEIRQRADGLEESVTERTRELQAERDRTHAILETVGESVVVTGLDGEVLFANPATTDLTGFSRDELLGQRLWHNWSAQTLADAWPGAQQALAAGQAWQGEVFGRRKDGVLYVARLTASPLHDAGAPRLPVGAVWVQRDITDLKQAERLKDQFVSNVSHELRTPISIIGLSCDNLDIYRDRLNEDQRWQLMRDIHDQAHLLSRLVEDIMVLSRIDVGRVSEEHTQVDLAGLLAEEVDRQQVFAEKRYQDLALVASHPILVQGNALQLRQVVRNLLDNAIKYTPQGGRVRCTCEVRTASPAEAAGGALSGAPQPWVVIEIADNGIGIAPEAIPAIFERFYRGQVEGAVPGSGLGLPIARELTQLHGGWIDVASEPGVGSTFTVYLPWPGDESEGLGSAFRGG